MRRSLCLGRRAAEAGAGDVHGVPARACDDGRSYVLVMPAVSPGPERIAARCLVGDGGVVVQEGAPAGSGDEDLAAVGADGHRPPEVVLVGVAVVAGHPLLPAGRSGIGDGGVVLLRRAAVAGAGDVEPAPVRADRQRGCGVEAVSAGVVVAAEPELLPGGGVVRDRRVVDADVHALAGPG